MKYIRFFLCGVLLQLLSCCSSPFVCGKYVSRYDTSYFLFHPDSVFEYRGMNACHTKSSGKWLQQKGYLLLNDNALMRTMPISYEVVKGKSRELSTISVAVVTSEGKDEMDYICAPVKNELLLIKYTPRGSYSFRSTVPLNSLYFRTWAFISFGYYYDCLKEVYTEQIYPNLAVGDDLKVTIHIVDSLYPRQDFDNEKIKIRRKSILYKKGKNEMKFHLER